MVDFFETSDNNLEDINSYETSLMEKVKTIEELNSAKKRWFCFCGCSRKQEKIERCPRCRTNPLYNLKY